MFPTQQFVHVYIMYPLPCTLNQPSTELRLSILHRADNFWTPPHPYLTIFSKYFPTSRISPSLVEPGLKIDWNREQLTR